MVVGRGVCHAVGMNRREHLFVRCFRAMQDMTCEEVCSSIWMSVVFVV
ncbi:hypothetical protein RBSWK_03394 [Rhodopirellula baltica SWK14]|uniref:Uncharacterized protein n=1 Tax=Rhodopirellula baltica SWK14 TaxID=993516 RepID=L7CEG1_RHOBT|nr:hypothetical protein RBSWK_03394 [Rhodopirellula baltica SWK14]